MNEKDHDDLTKVIVLLNQLIKNFENHLAHHFAITIIALSAGFIGVLNFAVGIILIAMKL